MTISKNVRSVAKALRDRLTVSLASDINVLDSYGTTVDYKVIADNKGIFLLRVINHCESSMGEVLSDYESNIKEIFFNDKDKTISIPLKKDSDEDFDLDLEMQVNCETVSEIDLLTSLFKKCFPLYEPLLTSREHC